MSKLFKQAQGVQSAPSVAVGGRDSDVGQLIATIEEPEVANDIASLRLQNCPTFALGSSELLFSHGDEHTQLAAEAYCGLRTRLLRLQSTSGIRSLVISSAGSEEGKTLTTLNLALCIAQLPKSRVLVVDSDLHTHGLTALMNAPEAAGLADTLAGQVGFEKVVRATDNKNLYAITAGTATSPAPELFSSVRWKEFMGWCSEIFTLVLVDAPPIMPLADFELITAGCDGVLMVVRALRTNRELLQRAASQVDPKKFLGVVFNATENSDGKAFYSHYQARKYPHSPRNS